MGWGDIDPDAGLRIRAHKLADKIWPWKDKKARDEMYSWLRKYTGLSSEEAHISKMTGNRLRPLIRTLENMVLERHGNID